MTYVTWEYKILDGKPSKIYRTSTTLEMIECTSDRFGNMTEKTEVLGISKGFLCPKEINHTLLGGVSSRNR